MSRRGTRHRAAAVAVLLAGLLILVARLWPSTDDQPHAGPASTEAPDAAAIERGAYLAKLGNCEGCHTARGGPAYAGGRSIQTPFGTVFTGNLTPEVSTGLGLWSANDFWRALHHGRGRDGRALVPAFPYTEFTKVTRADSDALWAYLRSLPPVVQVPRAHQLAFPYNTQLALEAWRAVYFKPGVYQPDAAQSNEWNRGAYLTQGLGHCAACHAPRNRFGGPGAAPSGGLMAGERWWAPALAVKPRDIPELLNLLKAGQSALGTAMGPMADVVVQSTQHWHAADLAALAVYLSSLTATAVETHTPPNPVVAERGQGLYVKHCADCHGSRGEGVPGVHPPLAGNGSVLQPLPINLVHAVRQGGFAPATQAHPRPFGMPPSDLDDAAVADLLTYVRGAWGNGAAPVSPWDVLRAR